MRESMEGDVVEMIRTAKGSECGQADEVLPWRVVRFAVSFADIGATCAEELICQRVSSVGLRTLAGLPSTTLAGRPSHCATLKTVYSRIIGTRCSASASPSPSVIRSRLTK